MGDPGDQVAMFNGVMRRVSLEKCESAPDSETEGTSSSTTDTNAGAEETSGDSAAKEAEADGEKSLDNASPATLESLGDSPAHMRQHTASCEGTVHIRRGLPWLQTWHGLPLGRLQTSPRASEVRRRRWSTI